jgi:hypothetical protein
MTRALLILALATGCDSTAPLPPANWGSDQVSLTITDGTGTIRLLSSGSCYGAYGEITQIAPTGTFSRSGNFTQLMGAFPGKLEYSAEYHGTVSGGVMTLGITIPALQQTLGPFHLTAGVTSTWTACLFP